MVIVKTSDLEDPDLLGNDQMILHPPEDDAVKEVPASARTAFRIKKLELMRVAREENLRKIFPDLQDGHSYHFITDGNIDAISFLTLMVERHGPFDNFYCSTWTMSRPDCELLDHYVQKGAIKRLTFFGGDYFQKRETSVYASILQVVKKHNGRMKTFKNHTKLQIVENRAAKFWAVAESSANFTTNQRSENTVITVAREVYDFYVAWFEDLIARGNRKRKPTAPGID